MKKNDAIRVLIVDDHAVVREGLRAFLGTVEGITIVGEAADGAEALRAAKQVEPDVVLMDLVMPGMDGIEATRRLRETHPAAKIIVLTSFAGDDSVFPAIRAGASAYLLKDAGPKEVEETIRAAAAGEVRLHPDIMKRVLAGITAGEAAAPLSELTPREREVLGCLGRGLANKEIGAELFISEKTVKTHVSSLLSKLELADRTQAAIFAVKNGFVRSRS